MTKNFSISEEHGLETLPPDALEIYSVGVSTAGQAEMKMAQANPNRHIIATTVDETGVLATQKRIQKQGFSQQIEVREEDVAKPLPYPDGKFDYIYARLVLHYLTKQQLEATLRELNRILKVDSMLFVVVRSADNLDALQNAIGYDKETSMTTYIARPNEGIAEDRKRLFHTTESLSQFFTDTGFRIKSIAQYNERLFHDYARTVVADHFDNLIELVAVKDYE